MIAVDGGFFEVRSATALRLGTFLLQAPSFQGELQVRGVAFVGARNFVNNGIIRLLPLSGRLEAEGPSTRGLDGAGQIELMGTNRPLPLPALVGPFRIGPGQVITGSGALKSLPSVAGRLAPGTPASPGTLGLWNAGPVVLETTAALELDLFGPTEFDRFVETGGNQAVALGGTLRVRLGRSYEPLAGTRHGVTDQVDGPVSRFQFTGAFSALDLPTAPAPQTWVVSIEPSRVTVGLGCNPADIAQADGRPAPDGLVTNGDFQLFFQSYFLGCTRTGLPCSPADIAGSDGAPGPDGRLDNGDFTLFFTAFFDGC